MRGFFSFIKDKLALILVNTLGVCTRCHKIAPFKKGGLCRKCFEVRKALVNAANPNIYNKDTYMEINKNLDSLLQYDFKKINIENAETVEKLTGIEKGFLLYCDTKSIEDFKIANYWFYQYFIDCNYLISKFLKNGYLTIGYNRNLSVFSSDFLKDILKQANLKVSGTKLELAKRIEENFSEEQICEIGKRQGKKFIITEKGIQEIGKYKPIITHDVDFENDCYSTILDNKLDIAYKMMCIYEQNKLIPRGLNCNWHNPPKKIFRINIDKPLPFNIPNCLKPFEKEIKATAIYTYIMGSNPRNAVPFFCQRIKADINKQILEKTFIFLCMYESGALNLNYSDIENLEQKQQKIDNAPSEILKNLSIDDFINAVNTKFNNNGLNISNIQYTVLKDGTYNFTYRSSQIGRIRIGKRSSKMQIITDYTVNWLENLTMQEYINNIDKWVQYAKTLGDD